MLLGTLLTEKFENTRSFASHEKPAADHVAKDQSVWSEHKELALAMNGSSKTPASNSFFISGFLFHIERNAKRAKNRLVLVLRGCT
jgi:hypothetical protein